MKHIFQKPGGELRIVTIVTSDLEGLTPQQKDEIYKARLARTFYCNTDLCDCDHVGTVEDASLPSKEFRSCWRYDGSKVRIDPHLESVELWKRVRNKRDQLLSESDGMFMRAKDLNQNVNSWSTYRQALRDVTLQPDPKNIIWPSKPE